MHAEFNVHQRTYGLPLDPHAHHHLVRRDEISNKFTTPLQQMFASLARLLTLARWKETEDTENGRCHDNDPQTQPRRRR